MRFLDIVVVLRLNLSQISFNLVEIAFATRQLDRQIIELIQYSSNSVLIDKEYFCINFIVFSERKKIFEGKK